MARRLFDIVVASIGLLLAAPLIAIAAVGIRLTSPGPVLYPARRAGRNGRPFTMYKLRTMHVARHGQRCRVTAVDDPRVFAWGRLLRMTKIDEMPQFWNILRGDMSVIGPRPEDPDLVINHYAPSHWDTLTVRPGLSSPGSLYHDTHGQPFLAGDNPEAGYLARLLPLKLAIDLVYVHRASLAYDLRIAGRTLAIIAGKLLGRHAFPAPPELDTARRLVEPMRGTTRSIARPIARVERRRQGRPLMAQGGETA